MQRISKTTSIDTICMANVRSFLCIALIIDLSRIVSVRLELCLPFPSLISFLPPTGSCHSAFESELRSWMVKDQDSDSEKAM